jgi:hypothetical protein
LQGIDGNDHHRPIDAHDAEAKPDDFHSLRSPPAIVGGQAVKELLCPMLLAFADGPSMPRMMEFAGVIEQRILTTDDLDAISQESLASPNPQIRRLGLTALRLHSPRTFLHLKPLFEAHLDDPYPWCVHDALWGLEKMAFAAPDLVERVRVIADHTDHAGTKSRASTFLAAAKASGTPPMRTLTNEELGYSIEVPANWEPCEHHVMPQVPVALISPHCIAVTFKQAVTVPTRKVSIDDVIRFNRQHYAQWTILEEHSVAAHAEARILVLHTEFGDVPVEQAKLFALWREKLLVFTYQFPVASASVFRPLAMDSLSSLALFTQGDNTAAARAA